ncbi:ABC transporter permease [Vibrio fluvialis]|uniref:ABC transporter permease n=1 Tax=Vibrio fluvialis TaxID=676 RepID=UPI00117DD67F|nr:ABC transporter permease [Vibrio fluvialis]EKO3435209.1 ABC transporter permease [Vibrio fluvialis]MBY7800082.1 ABC transporter permease [Vibrio fluvialis]MBY8091478.1 ABC transporter permease [Vibrio fluvialis]MBY8100550.1 ABC transporter permease [Vibrio fluvialis]MBY8215410.1 ABC transporter permease [Vibrio fluvialis]
MLSALKIWLADCISSLTKWRVFVYLGTQDVKGRYQRTKLGILWPFMTISVWVVGVGVIYGNLFNQDLSAFLPYLASGFVLWGFIQSSLVEGCNSYLSAVGYIKQFNFPTTVYVLRTLISSCFNFIITIPILFLILIYFDINFGLGTLWLILGVGIIFIITFFHILLFSTVTLYIKDTPHLLSALLQLMFFVTPIIFTVDMLKQKGLDFVYVYNPFYYMIEVVRYPLLNNAAAANYDYYVCIIYLLLVAPIAVLVSAMTKRKLVYKL